MRIDLILCQPRHVDYPWFRFKLKEWRKYFDKVYIALTQGLEPDISQFLIGDYKGARFIKSPKTDGLTDWRHLAVKDVLITFSQSEWVLFLEQDFLMTDHFLESMCLNASIYRYDLIYYQEDKRIHPAFCLARKEDIVKTSMDFSANPPQYDHFGKFFEELFKIVEENKRIEIKELGFEEKKDFYHMCSLTQNYHCHKLKEPLFRPEIFLAYNYYCLNLPIKQSPHFFSLMKEIEAQHGRGDTQGFIKDFFPTFDDNSD